MLPTWSMVEFGYLTVRLERNSDQWEDLGRYAGQFHWLHSLDADSEGNLYATEVHTGQRVQKLVFLGVE